MIHSIKVVLSALCGTSCAVVKCKYICCLLKKYSRRFMQTNIFWYLWLTGVWYFLLCSCEMWILTFVLKIIIIMFDSHALTAWRGTTLGPRWSWWGRGRWSSSGTGSGCWPGLCSPPTTPGSRASSSHGLPPTFWNYSETQQKTTISNIAFLQMWCVSLDC